MQIRDDKSVRVDVRDPNRGRIDLSRIKVVHPKDIEPRPFINKLDKAATLMVLGK